MLGGFQIMQNQNKIVWISVDAKISKNDTKCYQLNFKEFMNSDPNTYLLTWIRFILLH